MLSAEHVERRSDWKSTATDGKKRPTLATAAHFLFSLLILTRVCVCVVFIHWLFIIFLSIFFSLAFFCKTFFFFTFSQLFGLEFFCCIHFAVYFVENTQTTLCFFRCQCFCFVFFLHFMIVGCVCQFGRFLLLLLLIGCFCIATPRKPIVYPISKADGREKRKMINTKQNQINKIKWFAM